MHPSAAKLRQGRKSERPDTTKVALGLRVAPPGLEPGLSPDPESVPPGQRFRSNCPDMVTYRASVPASRLKMPVFARKNYGCSCCSGHSGHHTARRQGPVGLEEHRGASEKPNVRA
jgi:hypothetical protein